MEGINEQTRRAADYLETISEMAAWEQPKARENEVIK